PLEVYSAPVVAGGGWGNEWKKALYVDKSDSGKIKKASNGGEVIGNGKAIPKWKSIAFSKSGSGNNEKMDTLFELQGLQKSIPLMINMPSVSGSAVKVRFWVLVE
ncbi:MAG: hypothetical protein AAF975_00815, partial [Spirochaetota bacterium]